VYTLTEPRLTEAKPILEEFRTILHSKGKIDAIKFEWRLRKCLDVGTSRMKDLAEGLSKIERYRFLAVYYMENSRESKEIAPELEGVLARIYGIKSYHHPELSSKRAAFWDSMPKEE